MLDSACSIDLRSGLIAAWGLGCSWLAKALGSSLPDSPIIPVDLGAAPNVVAETPIVHRVLSLGCRKYS